MSQSKVIEKLNSLFKEETWGRIEPRDIGISRFKIIDDIFNAIVSEDLINEATNICINHKEESPNSITASYLLGLIGYHNGNIEYSNNIKKLIDTFINNQKWAVVEILSEKALEYGENSHALRSLALSLERLGRGKEAIPVLENLLKIDRFDANLAKKLAVSLVEEDPDKSIQFMKQAIEGFIKMKKYDEIPGLWNKLLNMSWEDIAFFERIKRLIVESKNFDLAVNLLKSLLLKYRDDDHPDQAIDILKNILEYKPDDTQARKELIKFYEKKYEDHSHLKQFMDMSKLNNFRVPPKLAIQDFEKNIVFDKENYAYHNSWGLGKIKEIDNERIIIDFKDKPDHSMAIQMALQSLSPIPKDHFYVLEYEDPDGMKELFQKDVIHFFELLIKSYGGIINLADIKRELIPEYIDEKSWGKWWTKTRTLIKKNPNFGVSEKKKNQIYMRDKPVTFSDELLDMFSKSESFSQKLDIALEFVNNISAEEGADVAQYFIDFFLEEAKGNSPTRLILSYFILNDLSHYVEPGKIKLDTIKSKVVDLASESQELPLISMKISSYDYKKSFVNLIEESREDWPRITSEFLFETPIRIHKYIFNNLIRSNSYSLINGFIERAIIGSKQHPEIFLWICRNIFSRTWDYEWLDFSREALVLAYFRLMNELKKIEIEGNRLKNSAIDILFDNDAQNLKNIVDQYDPAILRRIYELMVNVPYIEEHHGEKFLSIIREKYPDFNTSAEDVEEEAADDYDKMIVSEEGFEKMKSELDRLVNSEMVNITRELSLVSEASGDMRENVEYTALLEKQQTLKLAISRLDEDIKKAQVLDKQKISTDTVNIGTKVIYEDKDSGEVNDYIILGPWDADFENKILSYRSPIAKSFLGRNKGDEVEIRLGDETKTYLIKDIQHYKH